MANEGKLFNGSSGGVLWKILAGVNAIALAVTLAVLGLAISTFQSHGARITNCENAREVNQEAHRQYEQRMDRMNASLDTRLSAIDRRLERIESHLGGGDAPTP